MEGVGAGVSLLTTVGLTAGRTDVGEAGGAGEERGGRRRARAGQGTRAERRGPGQATCRSAGEDRDRCGQSRRMTGGRQAGRSGEEGGRCQARPLCSLSVCPSVTGLGEGRQAGPGLRPYAASPSRLPQPVSEEMLQLNQNYLQDNGPLFALRQMLSVGTLCFMLFFLLCLRWVQMGATDVLLFSALEIRGAVTSPGSLGHRAGPARSLQAVAVQEGPRVSQPL